VWDAVVTDIAPLIAALEPLVPADHPDSGESSENRAQPKDDDATL
jgi:hypothetical protein